MIFRVRVAVLGWWVAILSEVRDAKCALGYHGTGPVKYLRGHAHYECPHCCVLWRGGPRRQE